MGAHHRVGPELGPELGPEEGPEEGPELGPEEHTGSAFPECTTPAPTCERLSSRRLVRPSSGATAAPVMLWFWPRLSDCSAVREARWATPASVMAPLQISRLRRACSLLDRGRRGAGDEGV